jgi:hypothetical protein
MACPVNHPSLRQLRRINAKGRGRSSSAIIRRRMSACRASAAEQLRKTISIHIMQTLRRTLDQVAIWL